MTQRSIQTLTITPLVFVLLAGLGFQQPISYTFQSDQSSMTISGTSTLHDWTCDVTEINGQLQADTASESPASMRGISSTQVRIPVKGIDCDKNRMNNNLYEALEANAYPTIYFMLDDAQVGALPDSSDSWFQVDATGELIIAGARRTLDLPVKAQRLDNGQLRFVGSTSFKMSEWDVKPPSVMLGTIKTGDKVTIDFDVVVAPKG